VTTRTLDANGCDKPDTRTYARMLGTTHAEPVPFSRRWWHGPAANRGPSASMAPQHRPVCGSLPNFAKRAAGLFPSLWVIRGEYCHFWPTITLGADVKDEKGSL